MLNHQKKCSKCSTRFLAGTNFCGNCGEPTYTAAPLLPEWAGNPYQQEVPLPSYASLTDGNAHLAAAPCPKVLVLAFDRPMRPTMSNKQRCSKCRIVLLAEATYCHNCGEPTDPAASPLPQWAKDLLPYAPPLIPHQKIPHSQQFSASASASSFAVPSSGAAIDLRPDLPIAPAVVLKQNPPCSPESSASSSSAVSSVKAPPRPGGYDAGFGYDQNGCIQPDHRFRLGIIGPVDSGKSALFMRLTDDQYHMSKALFSRYYAEKSVMIHNHKIRSSIWEHTLPTKGEKEGQMDQLRMGTMGLLLCIDLSEPINARQLCSFIDTHPFVNVKICVEGNKSQKILLVGTKLDLIPKENQAAEQLKLLTLAKALKDKYDDSFISDQVCMTSARTSEGVQAALETLLARLIEPQILKEKQQARWAALQNNCPHANITLKLKRGFFEADDYTCDECNKPLKVLRGKIIN